MCLPFVKSLFSRTSPTSRLVGLLPTEVILQTRNKCSCLPAFCPTVSAVRRRGFVAGGGADLRPHCCELSLFFPRPFPKMFGVEVGCPAGKARQDSFGLFAPGSSRAVLQRVMVSNIEAPDVCQRCEALWQSGHFK